jgi:glycogen debranching enzyme
LFGRDSLITALQVLPERPDVARATLRAHAALQGRREDEATGEEPGKIVHEHRRESSEHLRELGWESLLRHGGLRYYGSADATSWFLIVLAALGDAALAAELEASWRAAGGWLERALARGGGLVRYGPRRGAAGLTQQGWRDADDPLAPDQGGSGILRADGTLPEPPIADADCQAAAVAAMRALHRLSEDERFERAAVGLQERIEGAFGPETMALEAGDREVVGAGSQLGWLLWAGALSPDAADRAAERMTRPDVLTDFGLRTLSSEHAAYGPRHYHRGSVWPFDSWIGWGGLRAAGREREAERVRAGVLEAIERLGGAPELYAVTDDGPEPIPLSNRVQAWTVGARFALRAGWTGTSTPNHQASPGTPGKGARPDTAGGPGA